MSTARKLRRHQERQMVKGMRAAMRQIPQAAEPHKGEQAEQRLQTMGVKAAHSMLWTPPSARAEIGVTTSDDGGAW